MSDALKQAAQQAMDWLTMGQKASEEGQQALETIEALLAALAAPQPAAQPAAPQEVAWRAHVEQRLQSWRQSFVNKSGDQLALDDFMDKRSLDDLLNYVLDEWAAPQPAAPQAVPVAWRVHPFAHGIGHEGIYAITTHTYQVEAWKRKGFTVEPLYTAPQPSPQPAAPAPAQSVPPTMPPAYMLAKLQMVMPLFQESRDALTAITEQQRKLHGISPTLAERMDEAGTFSLDDWQRVDGIKQPGSGAC